MKGAAMLMAVLALGAQAETFHLELREGETVQAGGAQCVAARAMSTNATGSVTLKRIARHVHTWLEYAPQTNYVTETRTTVVRRTVTNDVVTAWITNAVSSTRVASNFWARAVNATPTNHPYANMVYTTNRVEAVETVTNIVSDVVTGTNVALRATVRSVARTVTNELATLTLSGGFAQTALENVALMPGDEVTAEGAGMKGGRALLLLRR